MKCWRSGAPLVTRASGRRRRDSGQELGGVGEHDVALAAFVAEAFGQVFGVSRIVDAVLGEGAAPGFVTVGGGPGVQLPELGRVAGESGPEAFP